MCFVFQDGLTALHIATIEGNIKIVHLLIDKNTNMNRQDVVICKH